MGDVSLVHDFAREEAEASYRLEKEHRALLMRRAAESGLTLEFGMNEASDNVVWIDRYGSPRVGFGYVRTLGEVEAFLAGWEARKRQELE